MGALVVHGVGGKCLELREDVRPDPIAPTPCLGQELAAETSLNFTYGIDAVQFSPLFVCVSHPLRDVVCCVRHLFLADIVGPAVRAATRYSG